MAQLRDDQKVWHNSEMTKKYGTTQRVVLQLIAQRNPNPLLSFFSNELILAMDFDELDNKLAIFKYHFFN